MKKQRLGFDIILLGAPASGKDTQAALLERKFALKPVESGVYLRGLIKNKTKLGALLRNNFSKGLPAPIKIVKEFLDANFKHISSNQDLIFVGNPRLKPEAEYLNKLALNNHRNYLVFYINLPEKEIWERSEKRMRNGDDTKYIQTRINWHKKQVSKTIRYFQKLHKLEFIDGNRTIKEVNKEILKAINDYKRSRTN
jgi:adenylate kinase